MQSATARFAGAALVWLLCLSCSSVGSAPVSGLKPGAEKSEQYKYTLGHEPTAKTSWQSVQQTEARYYKLSCDDVLFNDDNGKWHKLSDQCSDQMREVVVLRVKPGIAVKCAGLFLGTKTSARSRYELSEMDDSIHIREGAPTDECVIGPQMQFEWPHDARIEIATACLGHTGEMHQNAYKNVIPLPLKISTNKDMQYAPLDLESRHLKKGYVNAVFLLLKSKHDRYIKKYVWILQAT